ncbi:MULTISPECIES: phosphoribosylformylglycinamidine synthase [Elizabethkingia]|uniref:Phosphoribosylformylglycinamidine synthase n=1 Tax=Elizabethkingia meningoseptica TaxID=238 RepID=A0A1T3FKI3_ELIME|nr:MULTISPECIES: phosphoribosylformylglycinamidine synthase [Elizabethkingia]AQX13638.1 phosphoribosylformylglycinamidine synthase [Elizabethkingia meningoseptica]MBG0515429.1 phosphoribosylformylglycinamidine synthase [Elizabethkingia meningoseptica]MDE5434204.1 phosphoribosylformylglycinamidine synthase [Elizabethkingia meningoseptica]MDE5481077.1 phosphoribosylformylglycinamidine synthase [Elizabethkingia meningoseptica]MDE5536801.1 phosphoribosylformylglycinamidine synthase [Elizabethkingi
MNYRIFVEKKGIFDVESPKIFDEIKEILPQIKSVKVYNIYDIFGLEEKDLNKVANSTFVDPVTDILHLENPVQNVFLATEFLPGQYDQRADSAEQCISILTDAENAVVRSGKLIEMEGVSEADLPKIKDLLINKVESREKDLSKLEIPAQAEPKAVPVYEGFINFNAEQLAGFYKEHGFAFGLDDLEFIQNYFKTEQRNPTETELKVLDTYWSDHCRHTTFETALTDIRFEDEFKATLENIFNDYLAKRKELNREHKPISLMDLGTVCAKYFHKTGKLENLVISDEINACTIEIEAEFDGKKEPWYLLFKNETHNHPTEIEPFGGASTCLGGAIRDPLSGRSFVYQAMRLSGAADILEPVEKTLPGKLPQKTISKQAANGYSSYGNQIGLATTMVNEIYDEGYKAKRMEVGFVVGAVPTDWVRREKPQSGDLVIILGGATGRDGVGGATGSSKEQDETSIHTLSTEVQKGNAVEERKIQRLFRKPEVTKLIKKSNDFGAGGVSVAIGEIADSLDVNLDVLPLKYDGLNGTELAISESQERMAVVISPEDKAKFIQLCEAENIKAVHVATVTDSGRMQIFWKGDKIVDLSREFLDTNGCAKTQDIVVNHLKKLENKTEIFNEENFLKILKDKNVASQKGLLEMFDSTVGGTTVAMPLGGMHQLTPMEGSVQTLPIEDAISVETVSLASWGFDAEISSQNSLLGSAYAVVESVAKIVAMGGDYKKIRLSFQEYFEKLGDKADKWGKPFASLLGAYNAQMELGLAAIGGKDSMSGTYLDLNVPPTLISFACANGNKRDIISPEFKKAGNKLYFFEHKPQENGLPNYEKLKNVYEFIHAEIKKGNLVSVKTIKDGGLAVALAKMSFGNQLGAEITVNEKVLLEKNLGSLIIETTKVIENNIFELVGEVKASNTLKINNLEFVINNLLGVWTGTFNKLFPTQERKAEIITFDENLNGTTRSSIEIISHKIAKPKVFIPLFPGTNCEYETLNAFRKEGAEVNSIPLINLSNEKLDESLNAWVKEIDSAQILTFAGGFSAGDEPDGSAKFIVNVLKNEKIRSAVHRLLDRDGLVLGICNGFQALVKSGLLPYGEIRDLDETSPTLTFNAIGRHISQMVNVKVLNDDSPWLKGTKGQTFTIPISHGEGRFYASKEELENLYKNGQIATQYVDLEGNIAHGMPFNPNASLFGIEGITSKSGKIFGRMGHTERFSNGLMKNIPSANYHNVFKNGVDYFKD